MDKILIITFIHSHAPNNSLMSTNVFPPYLFCHLQKNLARQIYMYVLPAASISHQKLVICKRLGFLSIVSCKLVWVRIFLCVQDHLKGQFLTHMVPEDSLWVVLLYTTLLLVPMASMPRQYITEPFLIYFPCEQKVSLKAGAGLQLFISLSTQYSLQSHLCYVSYCLHTRDSQ